MYHVLKPAHMAATKFFGHPVVKPALTHSGIVGFAVELFHAILLTVHHAFPYLAGFLAGALTWDEAYEGYRDLNLAWAALALGLVIYADNAHHVLEAMNCAEERNRGETQ